MLEGQEKLLNIFNTMTIQELPHTMLLCGEEGCGKHTLSKYIADRFNLEYVNITETFGSELFDTILARSLPTFYFIDLSTISMVQQNVLLKFIEEANDYIYVCLSINSKNLALNTILNRCVIYEFVPYTREQLKDLAKAFFGEEELPLKVYTTPGQMRNAQFKNLKEVNDLSIKFINSLHLASFQNTLSLSDKFNYKDLYDKYDVYAFMKLLLVNLNTMYLEKGNKQYFKMYEITNKYLNRLIDKRLNKQNLFESYLIECWESAKCQNQKIEKA